MMKENDRYNDIIHLPHHVSLTRQRMPISDRAAQFSPFAALTGHEAAIKETARLTDEQIELDEDRKTILNNKLQEILDRIAQNPEVTVIYFLPDVRKPGGTYVSCTGRIRKIDRFERIMVVEDGTRIRIEDIYDIIIK